MWIAVLCVIHTAILALLVLEVTDVRPAALATPTKAAAACTEALNLDAGAVLTQPPEAPPAGQAV